MADTFSTLSTDVLQAELARRMGNSDPSAPRPVCGSGKRGNYETGLHIFALFLILLISTLGELRSCSFVPSASGSFCSGRAAY